MDSDFRFMFILGFLDSYIDLTIILQSVISITQAAFTSICFHRVNITEVSQEVIIKTKRENRVLKF
jgi:hypothetical protein